MIRRTAAALLIYPIILSYAAAAEVVKLAPKSEKGEIKGVISHGNTQSFQLVTEKNAIEFFVDATNTACVVTVDKSPGSAATKRIAKFPANFDQTTKPGDQFTFVVSQSRDAWVRGVACNFSVKVNGG